MTILKGRGCLAAKININFFVRNEVLNHFHTTVFSTKKKKCFQTNLEKVILGGMTIFQGMKCQITKMNVIDPMGNGVLNMALKFFP